MDKEDDMCRGVIIYSIYRRRRIYYVCDMIICFTATLMLGEVGIRSLNDWIDSFYNIPMKYI